MRRGKYQGCALASSSALPPDHGIRGAPAENEAGQGGHTREHRRFSRGRPFVVPFGRACLGHALEGAEVCGGMIGSQSAFVVTNIIYIVVARLAGGRRRITAGSSYSPGQKP